MQRLTYSAVFILTLACSLTNPTKSDGSAFGSVVYDSLEPLAGGGFAIESLDIGQSIVLHGNARRITRIDLQLGDGASDNFRIRFYALDTASGEPSTLIWESPTQSYPFIPPSFNSKIISVAVPAVLVPTEMAWTVAPVSPSTTSNLMVLTGSLSPSVGTHLNYWQRSLDLNWHSNLFSNGTFAARLVAVPEPDPVVIAAICAVVAMATARAM